MALHSRPGCFKEDTLPQSGRTLETNCALDQGCIVAESKPNSFGPSFAQAGGGVYALLMEATGFNIWFFSVSPTYSHCVFHCSSNTTANRDTCQPRKRFCLLIAGYLIVGHSNRCLPANTMRPQRVLPSPESGAVNDFVRRLVRSHLTFSNGSLSLLCRAGNPSIYETTCPGLCVSPLTLPKCSFAKQDKVRRQYSRLREQLCRCVLGNPLCQDVHKRKLSLGDGSSNHNNSARIDINEHGDSDWSPIHQADPG